MLCNLSVRRGRSVRKIHRFVFLLLVCSVTMGLWTFSQARASTVVELETGTSGTCTWTYALVNNVKTLAIRPTGGDHGALGTFDWNSSTHKADTQHVVAIGTVKVGSSAKDMFADFSQATDMDLRGLDLSEVTNMEGMFYNCSALATLVGPTGWDAAKVKNIRDMFYGCRALIEVSVGDRDVPNDDEHEGHV